MLDKSSYMYVYVSQSVSFFIIWFPWIQLLLGTFNYDLTLKLKLLVVLRCVVTNFTDYKSPPPHTPPNQRHTHKVCLSPQLLLFLASFSGNLNIRKACRNFVILVLSTRLLYLQIFRQVRPNPVVRGTRWVFA